MSAATDRLRPVLLTTLTTVLGLTPLLYETSQQASFLKPTVITLRYGLGFGLVLVLLLVPSMLAAHADIAKRFVSLRRTLRSGRSGNPAFVPKPLASLAGAGLLLATVVHVAVFGDLVPSGVPVQAFALAMFIAGFAIVCLAALLLGWLLASVSKGWRGRALD